MRRQRCTPWLWLFFLVPASVGGETLYHVNLQLEGMIDPGVAAFVERVIQEADELGVETIVFEIDTFGGRVDAATVIRDAILDAKAMTIAFVNKRAMCRSISGGQPRQGR